jgi:hypothetical protein
MAVEAVITPMPGKGNAAVWAFHHMAALAAEDKRGITPPVDEDYGLVFCSSQACYSFPQRSTQHGTVAFLELPPHIHQFHRRQGPLFHSLSQLN